jgi:sporulation protein YlmC with PRC-barrel domain
MDLVRDILDKQVLDRLGRKMGKVDGVVLEERGGELRVAFLELGGGALARRLHPRLACLVQGLSRALGVTDGEPLRIPWSKVLRHHISVHVDVDADETQAFAWEHLLRDRLLRRVPTGPFKK